MEKYQNFINQIKQLQETCQHKDNWNNYEALRINWIIDALKDDNLAYARYLAARSNYHEEYLKILGVSRQFTNEQKQAIALFVKDLWSLFDNKQVNDFHVTSFLQTYGIKEIKV